MKQGLRAFKRGLLVVWLICGPCGLIAAQPAASAQTVDAELGKLDRYIAASREAWKAPGLAVAIVKDNTVLLSKGYGVRQAGEAETVDEHTLFAIASNSKAFTAAALAILVDEGKLSWDDKVRRHLPWFELYDPYVSAEIRVRDLLCHRSGLGTFSGDLLWYGTDYSPRQILQRARFLKPAGSFRADYGYSNLMFLAAGEVVAEVSGQSWSEFVRRRILNPLKMDRTVTSVRDLLATGNFAAPHKTLPDESRPLKWFNWDSMAAAGGIISSADDMAKWMRVQLKRGEIAAEQRLFSGKSSREMWSAHTPNRVSKESETRFPTTHFRAYGLGWQLADYKGRKLVMHGGGYDGMFSKVMLVPEENLGVVVLTNSMTWIADAIAYRAVDQFLGGEQKDWSKANLERFENSRKKFYARIQRAISPDKSEQAPPLDLNSYAGRYGGDLYGDAAVEVVDDQLVLRLLPCPKLVADLKHLRHNAFVIHWRNEFAWFEQGTANFLLDAAGKVKELKLDVPNDDLWFHELDLKRKAATSHGPDTPPAG